MSRTGVRLGRTSDRGLAVPEFASIEEWLGATTDDYDRVLAATGRARWVDRRAEHLQAQTVRRRLRRAERTCEVLHDLLGRLRIPERTLDALYSALPGFPLRRPTRLEQAGSTSGPQAGTSRC